LWAYKGFEYIFLFLREKGDKEYFKKLSIETPLIISLIIVGYLLIYLGFLNFISTFNPVGISIINLIKEYLSTLFNSKEMADLFLILFISFVVMTLFGSLNATYNFISLNLRVESEKKRDKLLLLISLLSSFLLISIALSSSKGDLLNLFLKVSQAASASVVLFYLGLSFLDLSYLKKVGERKLGFYASNVIVLLISLAILFFISPEILSMLLGVYLLSIIIVLLTSK